MALKRHDYSYLLDELRDISHHYILNFDYSVIDKNGVLQQDERIVNNFRFYMIYCMAYKNMINIKENNLKSIIDKETIDRALASYGMFNYFINTCIKEYCIYGDIDTGKITYAPYEPLADFFFENDYKKELLMNYLSDELNNVLSNESTRKRVKK